MLSQFAIYTETNTDLKNINQSIQSSMVLSITYLGLIVLANALLLSNYLIVRTMRLAIEAKDKLTQLRESSSKFLADDESGDDDFANTVFSNQVLLFCLGPFYLLYLGIKSCAPERKESYHEDNRFTQATLAFCFGLTGKDTLEARPFKGWKPIPYKAGAFTTTILIILFSILFSEKALDQTFGLDPTGTGVNGGGMCTKGDIDDKLEGIRERLEDRTNFQAAKEQIEFTSQYRDALQNDTTLYGEEGFQCTEAYEPRSKEAFLADPQFGKAKGNKFFPGMCSAAQAYALDKARTETCTVNICRSGQVVDADSIEAQNGDVSVSCDNCDESFENGVGFLGASLGVSARPELDLDYEITAASATYGYKEMAFCEDHVEPCPDYSKYDELTDVLQDYSTVQLEAAVEFAAPAIETVEVVVSETYTEIVEMLIWQLECLSYLYVGYQCLTLFFPSPLIIFRPNIRVMVVQFLFGARQMTFMLICLAVWWGARYFRTFELVANFEVWAKLIYQDPCVADRDYVQYIGGNISEICGAMVDMESNWKLDNRTIHNVLEMIPLMNQCCSRLPYESLGDLMPGADARETMESFGFEYSQSNDICPGSCYLMEQSAEFVGIMDACTDNSYVREEILDITEDTQFRWWDFWISSGILASIFLRAGVANFGIGLLRVADPLMQCGGKFLGPPTNYELPAEDMRRLRESKENNLRFFGFGTVFFWGLFMNLMMLNIFLASHGSSQEGGGDKNDATVGIILVLFSFFPLTISWYACRLVVKKIDLLSESHEDGESSSSFSCESESSISTNSDDNNLANDEEWMEASAIINSDLSSVLSSRVY
jgi:hypothetical protein